MRMIQTNYNAPAWFASTFEMFEKSLNGEAQSGIHAIRKNAMARFAAAGFPTTHDEEWRFTNVTPIAKTQFSPVLTYNGASVTKAEVERLSFSGLRSHRLVFVDGHFSSDLSLIQSLPHGVIVGSMASAIKSHADVVKECVGKYAPVEENAFTALNTAFLRDGAFISIPEKVVLEEPIWLLFISTGSTASFVSHPRNLVLLGKQSQVSIVERYVGLKNNVYLTNAVTEILAGEGAVLEHDKLQEESAQAFHVSSLHVQQRAGSTLVSNSISFGGALVRNNVTSVLAAEHAECTLNGLSLATGQQHVDNHTTIDHAHPHCNSHELYKSILDEKARGVFNGKIFVRKDAQKTDAKQTNKTLLLSDNATIDTKPQLEIFADDVKCTHGATVGQLDDEQIFYLRSRGIGEVEARDILTFAFASDVINRVHIDSLREQLDSMIQTRLRQGRLV